MTTRFASQPRSMAFLDRLDPAGPFTDNHSMTTSARMLVLIGTLIGVLAARDAKSQAPDPLLGSFRNPPDSAKPRVWWHWVDGNVSEDGIREDLRWLNQIGVGGVQNFDAALSGMNAQTQSGGFGEHNLRQTLLIFGPSDNPEQRSRSVLFHLEGRKRSVERTLVH